jgi:hypothetical protein
LSSSSTAVNQSLASNSTASSYQSSLSSVSNAANSAQSSLNSQSVLSSVANNSASLSINSSSSSSNLPINLEITKAANTTETTLEIKPFVLKNGQKAINYNIEILITNPNGKVIKIKTRTDQTGEIKLKVGNKSITISDLLTGIKAYAADFEITGGNASDLEIIGKYSAFAQILDSDFSTTKSNIVYWQISKSQTLFGLPRSGNIGFDVILPSLAIILTIFSFYLIFKKVKKN